MKKQNIFTLAKLALPFSLIFLTSFVLVSHTFNQKYDAQIDLSFVPKTIYTVEHVSKASATKISNKVTDIKEDYEAYKVEQELEEKRLREEEKQRELEQLKAKVLEAQKQKKLDNENNKNSKSSNIYDFKIAKSFQYMSQHDPRWKNTSFSNGDTIDIYGCGPTTFAMLVSNLTNETLTPDEAAFFAYNKNLYIPGAGSSHSIFVEGLPEFGIKASPFNDYNSSSLKNELKKGNMFVVLMKNGTFSSSTGHFILLLGIDKNGEAIIADSNSVANSQKSWDLDLILNEAKYSAQSGGPFWLVKNPL